MTATILVVEDHPANMDLMELLVTSRGYRFVPATDGAAGVAAAARERPDLIVCDIHLPLLDGFGVVAALRREPLLRGTPVVAVSALAMVGDRDKVLAAGFDGYLAKPIDPESFIAEIERFLPPALRAECTPVDTVAAPFDDAVPHGPCVLVVDDAPDGRAELRDTLEAFGFRVADCGSAAAALDRLRHGGIDLVLCDLLMPGGDGWQLLGSVKADATLAALPVVLVTVAPPRANDQQRARAAGAAALLHRPLAPDELAARVRACLRAAAPSTEPAGRPA